MRRRFTASPARVFAALTNPALLRQWMSEAGRELVECQVDLRPGGSNRYAFRTAKGGTFGMYGTYRDVVPERRIVHTEAYDGYDWEPLVTTTDLQADGAGTALLMTVRYPPRRFATPTSRTWNRLRPTGSRGWTGCWPRRRQLGRPARRKVRKVTMAHRADVRRPIGGVMAFGLCAALAQAAAVAPDESVSAKTREWFQSTEQALMDSMASGTKAVWERVMDPTWVMTSEEGQVLGRQQFLDELRPLPDGLSGAIVVKDLTVHELPTFAVVRYLADESESVFGQQLSVRYRVTNTYRRDGPDWKMVASHLAVVTQDPPEQKVSSAGWAGLVGSYRLLPTGWTFTVELRDGRLYAGRDPKGLRPLIPMTPDAFVLSGSLGEWLFVVENGQATRILNLRKFATLVWTRVEDAS